jgi:small GTP-binding protein
MSAKYIIKILTLGDSLVGKSSIVLRFSDNKFNETFLSTIGVDSKRKILKIKGEKVKVSIWDTAGQEKYQNIVKQYYNGANGVLLIYDISNKKSFERIDFWYKDLKKSVNSDEIVVFLVGNKIDLNDKRVVDKEEAEKYSQENNMAYFEVSAKTGEGIKELFDEASEKIMDKILEKGQKEDDEEDKARFSFINTDDFKEKEKKCCF